MEANQSYEEKGTLMDSCSVTKVTLQSTGEKETTLAYWGEGGVNMNPISYHAQKSILTGWQM